MKQVWDEPRLTRSADLSLCGREKRAIRFINSVVPEEATIVLPPTGEPGRFSLERSMQYFFFPRTLVQCDSIEQENCQTALSSSDIYILATQDLPPAESIMERQFAASPLMMRVLGNLWSRIYILVRAGEDDCARIWHALLPGCIPRHSNRINGCALLA